MDQASLWNGPGGQGWVKAQDIIDQALRPFLDVLIEAVPTGVCRVLDVGCGTGATTLAVDRLLKSRGCPTPAVMGVDVSEPMIAAASASGPGLRFVQADAATYPFQTAGFDLILSRFGVMFFEDSVAAFANLRRAGAQLCFVAWRGPEENEFMTVAERAADLPIRQPDTPGQFGLAGPDRTRRILQESGWRDIEILPIERTCRFPESELERYFTHIGPLSRALEGVDRERVRAAFEPYLHQGQVCFTAACWLVLATNRCKPCR